jgi:hypothetical protein
MTPHESALGGGDERDYNPIGINVKGLVLGARWPLGGRHLRSAGRLQPVYRHAGEGGAHEVGQDVRQR